MKHRKIIEANINILVGEVAIITRNECNNHLKGSLSAQMM